MTFPMTPPPYPAAFPVPHDPNAVIESDAPCRKCSYNLRGLRHSGRCPECGTPAGLSTLGDLLRYSDPAWLDKLVKGLGFMLWGILVAVAIVVVGNVLVPSASPAARQGLSIVAGLLSLYGAWLLTEPDPSGLGEAQYAAARKLVRTTLLIGLGGNVLVMMGQSLALPAGLEVIVSLIGVLTAIAGAVGNVAELIYLERLAQRIPDDKLAERAKFLRRTYGYGGGVFEVIVALTVFLSPSMPGTRVATAACFMGIFGLALVALGIMLIFFYIRLRRAFREQRAIAQQVWTSTLVTPA